MFAAVMSQLLDPTRTPTFLQPIKSTSLTYGSPVADDVFSLGLCTEHCGAQLSRMPIREGFLCIGAEDNSKTDTAT